jgi:methylase of polypeptide subunit release factors
MVETDNALLALLNLLKRRNYRFITTTPVSHARVTARPDRCRARSVEDVLGWSLPFAPGTIDAAVERLLQNADMLAQVEGGQRSLVRVSSLQDCLYLHSAFPTDERDAVFFGPDSYRFANLVTDKLNGIVLNAGQLIVDIGTGAGVGAIVASKRNPEARVAMTDVNPAALRFARINALAAGINAHAFQTDCLDSIDGHIDVALANPPFLIDHKHRFYRDGGDLLGGRVTVDMTGFVLPRLALGGRFILYSGSAILSGKDRMRALLQANADEHGCRLRYSELDPDVFGEELECPDYGEVDRIALIAAIFERG